MGGGQIGSKGIVPVNTTAESFDNTFDNNVTTIKFGPADKHTGYEISSKNVQVVTSPGTHDHGSSKVKLKNIVDYKWESKNYNGRLIAVHIDKKTIAYVINVNNKVSRMEGMVRVVNTAKSLRALIKGMTGEVLDLQFAHIENEHILASIDINSLYIHKIVFDELSLVCNLLLKIQDPITTHTPKLDKLAWCPFIETGGEDDEYSKLIVWSRGSMFQCFNVDIIVSEYGMCDLRVEDLKLGYLNHQNDSVSITWIALSPDGSTLGVGSNDGFIRFYQVYIHDKDPRCLHEWKPHNAKPISSFFFLDNLTDTNSETYWKFAITGADNNTEFKVWDCGTWNCLQTINFKSSIEQPLRFIAELDRTSSYLAISSLETRTCYIMQVQNFTNLLNSNGTETNDNANIQSLSNQSKNESCNASDEVYIKSITEFTLSSGILSFSIVDAAVQRYKCANFSYLYDEVDDYEEDPSCMFCIVVHMYIVQSKSMQECRILYQPEFHEKSLVNILSSTNDTSSSIAIFSNKTNCNNMEVNKAIDVDSVADNNEKNDNLVQNDTNNIDRIKVLKKETKVSETSSGIIIQEKCAADLSNVTSNKLTNRNYNPVNLMTPDAFTSSIALSNEPKTPDNISSEVLNTILMLASVTGQNPRSSSRCNSIGLLNLVNNKIIDDQDKQKQIAQTVESHKNFIAIDRNPGRNISDNLTSGGSSPSREVQEIMSLHESDKNSYGGDEILDECNDSSIQVNELGDANKTPKADRICQQTSLTSTTIWPKKIPEKTKGINSKPSAELQNAFNLISQANNSTSSLLLPSSLSPVKTVQNKPSSNILNIECETNSDDTNLKINELIALVKMQSTQINKLQSEISEIKKTNTISSKCVSDLGFKLEMQLSKLVEQNFKRCEAENNRKLSSVLIGEEVKNNELNDAVIDTMNKYIINDLGKIVANVIAVELNSQFIPLLTTKLDTLQQNFEGSILQNRTDCDLMIRDSISQVCKSKNLIDAFGKSVLLGVQSSLQAAFIESMSSTLIPAYEKSSQNMFKQLHDAFSVGIKEFMEQFDNYLQQLQPMHDSTEEILNKFSGFRQHLDSVLTKHSTTVHEKIFETRKDVKSIEILLLHQIRDTIRTEMKKSFENQITTLRSQTNTPAPAMYDMRETIRHLLLQGHINKAFHQALLANDLNLVEFTLESADHNMVFSPSCCLEQKVLLSLIQQISADMNNHNELKQNYLTESLLAINPQDPITREHAPKVFQELSRNCQLFLINYPKSSQCSNVRMLLKAIQAYKEQICP